MVQGQRNTNTEIMHPSMKLLFKLCFYLLSPYCSQNPTEHPGEHRGSLEEQDCY